MPELLRVLYVEDDPDIREIAYLALEVVGGFVVKICSSGEEALDEAVSFEPDLILLDVMMPGLDGPSTLKKMREQAELVSVPVVFMTAKVQPAEIDAYLSLGAVNVIHKPFDPMTLADQLRNIMASLN